MFGTPPKFNHLFRILIPTLSGIFCTVHVSAVLLELLCTQTESKTDKQTNAGEIITSLTEVISTDAELFID